jgi:hypothetical protein
MYTVLPTYSIYLLPIVLCILYLFTTFSLSKCYLYNIVTNTQTLLMYYIHTYYHIAPIYYLFGCTSYYIFPIQYLHPPTPTGGEGGYHDHG